MKLKVNSISYYLQNKYHRLKSLVSNVEYIGFYKSIAKDFVVVRHHHLLCAKNIVITTATYFLAHYEWPKVFWIRVIKNHPKVV